jgi:hypothetical protein
MRPLSFSAGLRGLFGILGILPFLFKLTRFLSDKSLFTLFSQLLGESSLLGPMQADNLVIVLRHR